MKESEAQVVETDGLISLASCSGGGGLAAAVVLLHCDHAISTLQSALLPQQSENMSFSMSRLQTCLRYSYISLL